LFRVELDAHLAPLLIEAAGLARGRDLTDRQACSEALTELLESRVCASVIDDCHDADVRALLAEHVKRRPLTAA
jgi:hypothetical protein